MPKTPKNDELQQQNAELTIDLQRTRADFENYRKRVESEKVAVREAGKAGAIIKLLPVVDTIERAVKHAPAEGESLDNWVQGVLGLGKNLDKMMMDLGLERINAEPGAEFDPELHQAVMMDEESEGSREVITEVLQPGYRLDGAILRPAMVKVGRE